MRYVDAFLRLRAAPDLLAARVFPNAKEVTEQMAAYQAYFDHLFDLVHPSDARAHALVVGDGTTPRAGALFAMRTRWQVTSVDPQLARRERWARIERLSLVRDQVERFTWSSIDDRPTIVIAVHSHAPLEVVTRELVDRTPVWGVVAMPCCRPQRFYDRRRPAVEYQDPSVLSTQNTLRLWRSTGESL